MNDRKIKWLMDLANRDAEFGRIKADFIVLEKNFMDSVKQLPDTQQDLIYDYVFASNEYDRRILEIACDHIQLPEENV